MKLIFKLLILLSITTFAQTTYNLKIKQGAGATYSQTTTVDEISFEDASNFTCGQTVLWGGEAYPTVLIGSQCWFQRNLNIGVTLTNAQNDADNGIIEKHCLNDIQGNCTALGGLYTWQEAMNYNLTEGAQGICPPGWHIPTYADFETLLTPLYDETAGEYKSETLKAATYGLGVIINNQLVQYGGRGTNTTGFSALYTGKRGSNGSYDEFPRSIDFWGSSFLDYNPYYYVYGIGMFEENDYVDFGYATWDPLYEYSVRCIKD